MSPAQPEVRQDGPERFLKIHSRSTDFIYAIVHEPDSPEHGQMKFLTPEAWDDLDKVG